MSYVNIKFQQTKLSENKAIAGGIAASGLSLQRSAHAEGKEEVKIGIIGSGGRAGGAAAESMTADPCVKLVAMCDVFEDRVKGKRDMLAQEFPDQVRCPDDHCFWDFDGYRKVIEASDVVLIACASKFHPMYAEAAIKAGKHVFVEKPHAIDPPGVRRIEKMCDLAREKGLSVMSGLQSRRYLGWQDIVRRIHDGEIGDVVAMQSMFLRPPYVVVPRKEGLSETEYQFSNWYHFCWLSGDDVIQSLVHNVDRMSWIMKGELPDWAFATAGRSGSFGEEYGDMFDHASVVYEYKSGPRLYALCRTTHNCYNNSDDVVFGSKGICYLGSCRFVKRNGEEYYRYQGENNNPYLTEQAELIQAVKSGKPVNCGDFMANSTMIGILGQIAAYQGNAVTMENARKAEFHFGNIEPDGISFKTEPPSRPDATGNYPIPLPGQTRLVKES